MKGRREEERGWFGCFRERHGKRREGERSGREIGLGISGITVWAKTNRAPPLPNPKHRTGVRRVRGCC